MTELRTAPRTNRLANLRAIREEAMKRRNGEPTVLQWAGFDLIGVLDIAIEAEAAEQSGPLDVNVVAAMFHAQNVANGTYCHHNRRKKGEPPTDCGIDAEAFIAEYNRLAESDR